MVSEGSYDTEDWRNTFWKFSLAITEIYYINIAQYYHVYCVFDWIKLIHGEPESLENLSKTFLKSLKTDLKPLHFVLCYI